MVQDTASKEHINKLRTLTGKGQAVGKGKYLKIRPSSQGTGTRQLQTLANYSFTVIL